MSGYVYHNRPRAGPFLPLVCGIVGGFAVYGITTGFGPQTNYPPGVVTISATNGAYYTRVRLNRRYTTNCQVDSGSDADILPRGDAYASGLNNLVFDRLSGTVGGTVRMARATLGELQVGSVVMRNVEVLVPDSNLNVCLLGTPWLRQFSDIQIRNGVMTLRQ